MLFIRFDIAVHDQRLESAKRGLNIFLIFLKSKFMFTSSRVSATGNPRKVTLACGMPIGQLQIKGLRVVTSVST